MIEEQKYGWQICQDEKLMNEFTKLHEDIVNQVIKFCKDHLIDIDEFYLSADNISGSLPYGSWQACTDSSFKMFQNPQTIGKQDVKPFIWSI